MSATQSGEVQELLQQLAGECRHKVEDRRGLLSKAMRQRPLTVNAPPGCPKDLAEQIDRHNAAMATWEAAWSAMGENAAGLALALPNAKVKGAVLEEKAAGLRARRYDVGQQLLDLIGDRGKVLQVVRERLAALIEAAEADQAKAEEKAEKDLKKAGWQSEAARVHGPGAYPQVELAQLAMALAQMDPVREAGDALAALRTADAQANAALDAQGGDLAAAEAELLAAWRVLTAGI